MAATEKTHYVAHVRIEKVTRDTSVSGGSQARGPAKPASDRVVEELTNITQKGSSYEDVAAIVTKVLEISKSAAE